MEIIKNKRTYILSFILLILFILGAVSYYNRYYSNSEYEPVPYQRSSGIVWTTQYHITYQSDILFDDSIQVVFDKVNDCASMFNKNSLVSKVNRNDEFLVDSMFVSLYKASLIVNKETQGAFDPTVSPLMKEWGFVEKTNKIPSKTVIDSIRRFVGIEKTELVGGEKLVKRDSRIEFDFSAIAKGLACDEVGRMLERNGVVNYLVEIGGEIALKGVNPDGCEWCVSVDSPKERYSVEFKDGITTNEGLVILRMSTGAIATSGNYRNYKVIGGKKVVHTMNPLTGYPEKNDLLSATIVANSCMCADAYATACMVMGVERSKSFLESRNDLGGFLVYSVDGDTLMVWSNNRFKQLTN
ncbi:MAG: FAD:protein FMN transferase [Bacteroidales bacterium]|nr:FAD:protein FMN transferase [Bacteroidales bacterium]